MAVQTGMGFVVEASIGLIVVFVISTLLFPVKLGKVLESDMQKQCRSIMEMLEQIMKSYGSSFVFISHFQIEELYAQTWLHYEVLEKTVKYEGKIYNYSDELLEIQITLLDDSIMAVRHLIDLLNEYDNDYATPPLAEELETLQENISTALQHIVQNRTENTSLRDLTRNIYCDVQRLDEKLEQMQKQSFASIPFQHAMQLVSFYQVLRWLAEEVLIAIYKIQKLKE